MEYRVHGLFIFVSLASNPQKVGTERLLDEQCPRVYQVAVTANLDRVLTTGQAMSSVLGTSFEALNP